MANEKRFIIGNIHNNLELLEDDRVSNDLISRSALLESAREYDLNVMVVDAVEAEDILAAPTVDVVEVVRCKDCVSHNLCKFEQFQGLNGFCSYGERKCNG